MSFRVTFSLISLSKNCLNNGLIVGRNFSRRSVGADGSYKVIKGRRSEKDQERTNLVWRDPNYDILASPSFPFFMPGNVGPAWYDTHTTVQNVGHFSMNQIEKVNDSNILCRAQTCPQVFRKTICELFPHRNLEQSELSVITITLKPDVKHFRKSKEIETEKLAQSFVITAKNVCLKLRKAGYWADFINPFSGRPYFSSPGTKDLYNTDEKFRCMDFEIFKVDNCTIVSNEQNGSKRSFIGSLFTNAPSKQDELNSIFTK